MKKICRKNIWRRGISLLLAAVLLVMSRPAVLQAREVRTVRVAFFPMQGYHTYSETEGYDGVDVAYLKELCTYTGW